MCGIVALVHLDGSPVDRALVKRMASELRHRGPDGGDEWVEGPIGLGHRRLAIFDVSSTGSQPMPSSTGRHMVAFNGALYDYRERRRSLAARGVPFRGTSDTEVLVNSLEHDGNNEFETFNGMFAFVAVDRENGIVHLVRDRHGIKPLYAWQDGRILIAASEIRAILAHPDVPKRPNPRAIREYLTFQNLFRPHSFFEGIYPVEPASHWTIRLNDGAIRKRRWWDYDFSHPHEEISFDVACEETRRLLDQAVRRQVVADVPVGSYLSGGMDSGAISSLASASLPRLMTFTCGFDLSRVTGIEANYDERRIAELTAALIKSRHYESILTAQEIESGVPTIVEHLEDLRLGMSYPNYYIAELASKFVKVALSGAGGDELFGGYPWRYYRVFRSLDREHFLREYFASWQRLIPPELHDISLSGALMDETRHDAPPYEVFVSVFDENQSITYETPEEQIGASLYFEARTFLSGILTMQDRISMAHGLEERVPFLDNDLVDLAMRIPAKHKLANLAKMKRIDENEYAKLRTRHALYDDGKNVLRQALRGLIPHEVIERPKQGFSSPEASWYRGEAMQFVQRRLSKSDVLGAFVRPDYVDSILQEHLSGTRNHRLLIWSFLCLGCWVEQHFPELIGEEQFQTIHGLEANV